MTVRIGPVIPEGFDAWSGTLSAEDVNAVDCSGLLSMAVSPRCPNCGSGEIWSRYISRPGDVTENPDGTLIYHFPTDRDPDYVECGECKHREDSAEPFEEAGRKAMRERAEAYEPEFCSECGQEL